MKTYNISSRISKQAKEEINRILSTHENYKKSFFFKPDSSADGRRRKELNFSKNNPDVSFIKRKDIINVSMSYSESCKNCYYSISITVNGESKNITVIKSLLK